MDKSEYRAKMDEMTAFVNAGDYQNAQTIADEIDWRRVKSARTLCTVSEVYEKNDRLPDSRRILELAYKRALVKTVAYRLVEVCLKLNDVDAAQDYYDDFADLAPMDNSKYILKYKIHRAKGDSLEQQIRALEEYKDREYTEPWAYELAALYSQAGNKSACVDACDDLILWFSEGPYVLKAMELKKKYVPLSPSQLEKYKKELAAKEKKTEIPSFLKSAVEPKDVTKEPEVLEEESKETNQAEEVSHGDEDVPVMRADEAIEKMDAAASSTVQAESGIKLPFGKMMAGISKPSLDPARMQSQLADSIRNVFAGINNKGTVRLDTKAAALEEKYEEPYQEDMSGYEIKDLELEAEINENIPREEPVLEVAPKEEKQDDQVAGQMSFEDFAKKEAEFDFEALFAETTNALAKELASGTFEQEKVVNTEEEADKVIAEEIARIVAEEVKEETLEEAEEPAVEEVLENSEDAVEVAEELTAEEDLNKSEECVEEEIPEETEEDIFVEIPVVEIDDAETEDDVKEEVNDIVTELNVNQYEQRIEEQQMVTELESVFVSEDEVIEQTDFVEENTTFDSITLNLEEDTAEENLTSKIIAETQKESTELKSVYEGVFEEEALITDPKLVVLPEEDKSELTYVPVEPRALTAEEKEIFTYFSRIPGLGEQVTVALSDVHNNAGDKTSKSGNFLIIGRQGSGKTRLYESMVLAICKDLGISAAKNAKIIARDFNEKDPAAIVAKLSGGFLAIEGAGELSDEAAEKLAQAMEFRTDSLVVVLEDEKEDLMNMLEKHPRLAEKFTSTIKIPVFTNDELVAFARIYAQDQGYRMDEMGVLALYTKIGDNQKDAEPITVGRVKEMMDNAMMKANKGHRKLSRRFSKNAVDEENRIILFEKDFE